MPKYTYIAKTSTGERIEGILEANDKRGALLQIEHKGEFPISVQEATAGGAKPKRERFKMERKEKAPKMSRADVLIFSRELSDLLSSGMTLGESLRTLGQRRTGRDSERIVTELRDEIIQGGSLSESLARRPAIFPSLYVSMVKAGEASGGLSQALERLVYHYERVQAAREKVLSAMIYPSIVLVLGGGTVVFIMVYVIPRFTSMFDELGSTLPLPTRILMGISSSLAGPGGLIALGVIVAAVLATRKALATKRGRFWWHGKQLKMPIMRNIVAANAYAHFATTLGSLLLNGVSVLKALDIVEHTVGNDVIAAEIHKARERVTDGASISRPLAEGGVFPVLLTDMLAVGERTGDMPSALEHIARRYENDLDRGVKLLTTVIEPLLMIVMAALVGFVAISMLLAVFDLTSGLNV